jgi:hypothetical protein
MRSNQRSWDLANGWTDHDPEPLDGRPQLVFVFGSRGVLSRGEALREVAARHPEAVIVGCSTAGEIVDTQVADDTLVATEVLFDRTAVRLASVDLAAVEDSVAAGRSVAGELVRGMSAVLPPDVQITGGLAADGELFESTLTCVGDSAREAVVAAVGFYGDHLSVGYGSLGGWDPFGPERLITRSEGNVLSELDGRNALDLYKLYLGGYAAQLPASALLFPLAVRSPIEGSTGVVRTVLTVNEDAGNMTFAGDMPEGAYARFMKANFERLIDGAVTAAGNSRAVLGVADPELALLISCVGRRMVLGQRVEEELESVRQVLGDGPTLTGFYSYGEIAPFAPAQPCELHNQTMTITLLSER